MSYVCCEFGVFLEEIAAGAWGTMSFQKWIPMKLITCCVNLLMSICPWESEYKVILIEISKQMFSKCLIPAEQTCKVS